MITIKNRYTGAVLLEIESLSNANLSYAKLSFADLRDANLSGANLSGAHLYGAHLSGANLYGANLSYTNLYGADLSGVASVIDAGQDVRGYRFVAVRWDDGLRIVAGCRWFTLGEALTHWFTDGEPRRKVDMIETEAHARGWIGMD